MLASPESKNIVFRAGETCNLYIGKLIEPSSRMRIEDGRKRRLALASGACLLGAVSLVAFSETYNATQGQGIPLPTLKETRLSIDTNRIPAIPMIEYANGDQEHIGAFSLNLIDGTEVSPYAIARGITTRIENAIGKRAIASEVH